MGAIKSKRCQRGHLMRGANLYTYSNGNRECKACSKIRYRKARRKKALL
jgi:hypothetical protein